MYTSLHRNEDSVSGTGETASPPRGWLVRQTRWFGAVAVSFEAGQPPGEAWPSEEGLPTVERELLAGDLELDFGRELVGVAGEGWV